MLENSVYSVISPEGCASIMWRDASKAEVAAEALKITARDLLEIARPRMRSLVEQSGETVNLAVVDGGEAVVLAQVECRQMMRALASPGVRVPLHCSGVGKALLASLPENDIAQILRRRGLPRLTPKTLTSVRSIGT